MLVIWLIICFGQFGNWNWKILIKLLNVSCMFAYEILTLGNCTGNMSGSSSLDQGSSSC